jgi:lysozyme
VLRYRCIYILFFVLVSITSSKYVFCQESLPRDQRSPPRSLIESLNEGLGATHPTMARPIFPLAPQLIMYFEGWEPAPYNDPSGYCTVGYGHLIDKKKCVELNMTNFSYPLPLSRGDGEKQLEADTLTARAVVQQLVTENLLDHEFGALVSFVFNVGRGTFQKSTLLKLLNAGYKDQVAKEFSKFVVSKNKIFPGLVFRRNCEAAFFKNDLIGGNNNLFNKSQCSALGAAPTSSTYIDIETGQEIKVN